MNEENFKPVNMVILYLVHNLDFCVFPVEFIIIEPHFKGFSTVASQFQGRGFESCLRICVSAVCTFPVLGAFSPGNPVSAQSPKSRRVC